MSNENTVFLVSPPALLAIYPFQAITYMNKKASDALNFNVSPKRASNAGQPRSKILTAGRTPCSRKTVTVA